MSHRLSDRCLLAQAVYYMQDVGLMPWYTGNV